MKTGITPPTPGPRSAPIATCLTRTSSVITLYKGYSGMKDVLSLTFKTYPAAIRATRQTDQIVAGQLHPLPQRHG